MEAVSRGTDPSEEIQMTASKTQLRAECAACGRDQADRFAADLEKSVLAWVAKEPRVVERAAVRS